MQTKLFIKGDSKVGKSTKILELVLKDKNSFSGFMVQRVFKDNLLIGFTLSDISLVDSVNIDYDNQLLFIKRNEKMEFNLLNFKKLLEKINFDFTKIVIMDEIGGMEMEDEEVARLINSVIKKAKHLICVVKSEKNYQMMLDHFEFSSKQVVINQELIEFNKNLDFIDILEDYYAFKKGN